MNSIEKLVNIFSHFPGIGPRQARRFVYYLLTRNNGGVEELIKNLEGLKNDVLMCIDCGRFFPRRLQSGGRPKASAENNLCSICIDTTRKREMLMIVPRDIDLESVEKSGVWSGSYFVLGGAVPILEKEPEKKIRSRELAEFVAKRAEEGLTEIVLAMNWNPEGENTGSFIEKSLQPFTEKHKIKISHLGKGFSMGTELEYADPDTLKNALKNRN